MRSLVLVLGLMSLGACAPIPIASTYPYSDQQKMQAAEHWRVLADDIATGIRGSVPSDRPVYVARKGGGDFSQGFHTYLETALAHQGYVLSPTPLGANIVDYSVQPVIHPARRDTLAYPWPFWLVVDIFNGDNWGRDTNSEVIVSVAAVSDGRTLFRRTATFYVPDRDIGQYAPVALATNGPLLPPVPVRISP
jgi:hypothetical protein